VNPRICSESRKIRPTSRFDAKRLQGLADEYRPGAPRTATDDHVQQVVVKTLTDKPQGRRALVDERNGQGRGHVSAHRQSYLDGVRAQAVVGGHVLAEPEPHRRDELTEGQERRGRRAAQLFLSLSEEMVESRRERLQRLDGLEPQLGGMPQLPSARTGGGLSAGRRPSSRR
jgi:hypothetical protein